MRSQDSEIATKKTGTKLLSKSKKNIPVNQIISTGKEIERQEMIATAAYYRAEKRGFTGNDADAMQDWLEAEMEIGNV